MESMSRRDFLTVIALLLNTGIIGSSCTQRDPTEPDTQANENKSEVQTTKSYNQAAGGESEKFSVTVDPNKCNGCGECVDVCPVDVFEIVNGKAEPVNAFECLGCESCIEVCSNRAISMKKHL
jgi:NAD-dependent dihydropyrimidine dehydrogenase PreA subunit